MAVAVAFCAGWWKAERIFAFMQAPIITALRAHKLDEKLVYTNPTDPFNMYMKVGLIAGLFIASPFILYQVWAFIAPGLYRHERRYILPFMVSTVGLFLAGGAFGYKMVYPAALDFLIGYGAQFQPMITIGEYTSLFLTVVVGHGDHLRDAHPDLFPVAVWDRERGLDVAQPALLDPGDLHHRGHHHAHHRHPQHVHLRRSHGGAVRAQHRRCLACAPQAAQSPRGQSQSASMIVPDSRRRWLAAAVPALLMLMLAPLALKRLGRLPQTPAATQAAAPLPSPAPASAAAGSGSETPHIKINAARAMQYVREVVAFGPRPIGSEAHKKLEAYLAAHLAGATIERDDFTAATPNGSLPIHNIIAKFPGTKPGVVVIATHYDTLMRVPGFVGANDGGSGTGLLARTRQPAPRRQAQWVQCLAGVAGWRRIGPPVVGDGQPLRQPASRRAMAEGWHHQPAQGIPAWPT